MGELEGKHLVARLFKSNTVCFEFGAEAIQAGGSVRLIEPEQTGTVAFVHRRFGRVRQSADCIFFFGCYHTVYQ